MSRYGTHRQCRAAKNKISHCHGHEIYITRKQLHKIICASAGAAAFAYLKGIIVGYLIFRAADRNKGCGM